MKKPFHLAALAASLLASVYAELTSLLAPLSREFTPACPALPSVPRRDLLTGHMPEQQAPTARVVRPQRDQRPGLRIFTLPRTDFAF